SGYAAPSGTPTPGVAAPVPAMPKAPNGNGHAAAPAAAGSDTKAILEYLQKIDARLQKVEGAVFKGTPPPVPASEKGAAEAPPPPAAQAPKDGLAVAGARCAACHDKATAATKGSNFVLLEGGKLASSLTPAGRLKSVKMVLSARMPIDVATQKPA